VNAKPGLVGTVDILLATYNGAAYLPQQLDSLFAQSHQNWRLIVRDDGSGDNTLNLLREARAQHPNRIRIIEDDKGSLGATHNFGELLCYSTAAYIMFCDQDDVWLPNKIAVSLQRIVQLEQQHGRAKPILVYTDQKLVDEKLNKISASLWSEAKLNPQQGQTWNRLLIDNVASGCTMLFNRALCDVVTPIPKDATIHDWWVALIASLLGVIEPIYEPTILYRLHQNNVVGIGRNIGRSLKTMFGRSALEVSRKHLLSSQKQTAEVVKYYGCQLDAQTLIVLEIFSNLHLLPPVQRRLFLIRHSILRVGIVRNIGLLLRL
jgi:glycosyltransferase involved in cell wall biosynthesis